MAAAETLVRGHLENFGFDGQLDAPDDHFNSKPDNVPFPNEWRNLNSATEADKQHRGHSDAFESMPSPVTPTASPLTPQFISADRNSTSAQRTLRVYNIPEHIQSSTAREPFAQFGEIEEWTCSVCPNGQPGPVTLQYGSSDVALKVYRILKDKDIYGCGTAIALEYTSAEGFEDAEEGELEEGEAHDAKLFPRNQPRSTEGLLLPTKINNPGLDPSLPKQELLNTPDIKTTDQPLWTNGLPPTAPRSMRRDVSPSYIRHTDSYRPDTHQYHSDIYKSTTSESGHKAMDYTVPSEFRSPEYTRRMDRPVRERPRQLSNSVDDKRHGFSIDKRLCRQPSNSPIQVRNANSRGSFNDVQESSVETPEDDTSYVPRKRLITPLLDRRTPELSTKQMRDEPCLSPITKSTVSPNEAGKAINSPNSLTSAVSNTTLRGMADQKRDLDTPISSLANHLTKQSSSGNGRGNGSASNSPSGVVNRFLSQKDETLSMISGTTSSSTTSVRKLKCADCKNSGSEIAPLVACQICPRKFHSCCGDPRPSLTKTWDAYTCGRCLRIEHKRNATGDMCLTKAKPDDLRHTSVAEDTRSLVIPHDPSVHGQNDNLQPSHNAVKREEPPNITEEHDLVNNPTAIFKPPSAISSALKPKAEIAVNNQRPGQEHLREPTVSAYAERMASRYKRVTCARWKKNIPCRREDECLFSHRQESVDAPDGKFAAKAWTCYEWKERGRCRKGQECPYAHCDTMLFMGIDNRPSLKHITCYWWELDGRCKYSRTECLYAHTNTGIYARNPNRAMNKGITCSYWKKGFCYKSERECPYSHHDTDARIDDSGVARINIATNAGANASLGRRQSDDHFETRNTTSFPTALHEETSASKAVSRAHEASNDPEANKLISTPFPLGDRVSQVETRLLVDNLAIPQMPHNDVPVVEKVSLTSPLIESASSDHTLTSKGLEIPKPVVERTLDPRKRRRMLTEHPSKSTIPKGMSTSRILSSVDAPKEGNQEFSTEGIFPPDGFNFVPGRAVQPAALKKCELCWKLVLGTSLRCVGCTDKTNVMDEKVDEPNVGSSQELGEAIDGLIKEAQFQQKAPESGLIGKEKAIESNFSSSTNLLKRHASDDHMFLTRKRSKPDTSLLPGQGQVPQTVPSPINAEQMASEDTERHLEGQSSSRLAEGVTFSAHPDNLRLVQSNQDFPRVDSSEALLSTGKAPSLEDLIRLEKTKKGLESPMKSTRPTLETEDTSNTRSTSECGTNPILYDEILPPVQEEEPLTDPLPLRETLDRQREDYDKDLVPNVEEVLSLESDVQASRILLDPPKHSPAGDMLTDSQSIFFPVAKKSRCKACRKTHKRCDHNIAPEQRDQPLPISQDVTADELAPVNQPLAVARKSCDHCRMKHKRCVHAQNGSLDPDACRTYVSDRNGIPDTSRPRIEWDHIVAVANQPQLSQGNQPDMLNAENIGGGLQRTTNGDSLIGNYAKAFKKIEESYEESYDDDDDDEDDDDDDDDDDVPLIQTRPRNIMLKLKRGVGPADLVEAAPVNGIREAEKARRKTNLLRKGVILESDSEPEVDYVKRTPQTSVTYGSGAFANCRTSLDLFAISPELHPDFGRLPSRFSTMKNGKMIKPPKKQIWKNLLAYQCRDRLKTFGNAHWEVNRPVVDRQVVMTSVPEVVGNPFANAETLAMEDLETRLVNTSFKNFLGMPKSPVVCVGKNPNDLAFKERETYRDRDVLRSIRNQKRVTEEEKFPFITSI